LEAPPGGLQLDDAFGDMSGCTSPGLLNAEAALDRIDVLLVICLGRCTQSSMKCVGQLWVVDLELIAFFQEFNSFGLI
jgi:hypothetical protein